MNTKSSTDTAPDSLYRRVAFLSIARSTFDLALAQMKADSAVASLISLNYTMVGTGPELLVDEASVLRAIETVQSVDYDLLILFQATFADSTMVVTIAGALADHRVPLLLWAVPDDREGGRLRLNSLCGINLAAHALRQQNIAYEYVYCEAKDPAALNMVTMLAGAGHAARALHGSNIGVIGQHPDGFETCAYDPVHLRQLFGIEIKPVALTHFLDQAATMDGSRKSAIVQRISSLIENMDELDAKAVSGTAGVYAALRQTVEATALSGVAVRCWPEFFTELDCAACGAMSMLSEEGCPASCEADVNGTVTSMLLQAVSDEPAFITDLVSVDAESDTAVLWHCGLAPVSMADPHEPLLGTVHSNRKRPLLFEFPLKPGRVTVARLHRRGVHGGLADYQLVVGSGEMVRAPISFGGTSGVLRFDQPAQDVLDIIIKNGLEHHLNITYGDHSETLRAFASLVGLPVIELTAQTQTISS